MDNKLLNKILDREDVANQIKYIVQNYEENTKDIQYKKGIYIYGSPGCGKTQFVVNTLKEVNFDVIKYDAGDVRNKSLIDTITSNNVSKYNVLHMMTGQLKKIAIVMDEIDGMNSGDKGGITSLIKLIRQKKTKKQKTENATMNPIICIGNYFMDKKIRELMKVCHVFELKMPTREQTDQIIMSMMPDISSILSEKNEMNDDLVSIKEEMLNYAQGDMRKISFLHKLYTKQREVLTPDLLRSIFHVKSYHDDSKHIVSSLFNTNVPLKSHDTFINETERTIVALLWHENIIDMLEKIKREKSIPFYLKVLNNICFADYIDRITFQNQIWIFNEISSLMKTLYNNKLFHEEIGMNSKVMMDEDVRFTKVLTKYSTEYNNIIFVYMLCQELDMDRKDMISFFQELRLAYDGVDFNANSDKLNEVENIFVDTEINKLDIKRMYRYLDKNVKKDKHAVIEEEYELEDE
jgi:DNA polymerase III delta prime subunit